MEGANVCDTTWYFPVPLPPLSPLLPPQCWLYGITARYTGYCTGLKAGALETFLKIPAELELKTKCSF